MGSDATTRVCILGNSVGLRIRPPRESPAELTYAEILEQKGYAVRNLSRAGVMISEAFALLDDEVISHFPDVVIVQFGVVEVCSRQTFRALNNLAISNYYLNGVFRRNFEFPTLFGSARKYVFRAANALTRRFASFFDFSWQWLTPRKFLLVLEAIIERITKETAARVIVLGVNPCSDRIERLLGSSQAKIHQLNQEMKAFCEQRSRVQFLNPETIFNAAELDALVPDGVHLSARGHRLLAEELCRTLDSAAKNRNPAFA
jgi:lysophospholipase L1-like esterase